VRLNLAAAPSLCSKGGSCRCGQPDPGARSPAQRVGRARRPATGVSSWKGPWGPAASVFLPISGSLRARAPFVGVRFRRDTKKAGTVGLAVDFAPLKETSNCTPPAASLTPSSSPPGTRRRSARRGVASLRRSRCPARRRVLCGKRPRRRAGLAWWDRAVTSTAAASCGTSTPGSCGSSGTRGERVRGASGREFEPEIGRSGGGGKRRSGAVIRTCYRLLPPWRGWVRRGYRPILSPCASPPGPSMACWCP